MSIYVRTWRTSNMIAVGALMISLAGCEADSTLSTFNSFAPTTTPPPTPTFQQPADVQYYPSDEPLRLGLEYFNRGIYGVAERYFRDAVEKAPRDVTAWVGLAATYDRIGRFDLADRAYSAAVKLAGNTIEISQQSGLFVHAARRLRRRAQEVPPGLCARAEQSNRVEQSGASQQELEIRSAHARFSTRATMSRALQYNPETLQTFQLKGIQTN